MKFLDGKNVLITGGTGSFGQAFTKYLINNAKCNKIIIFSRDEFKQIEMKKRFNQENLRFFIGDVRDKARLIMAMNECHYVVHTAALKHVSSCEKDPHEALMTNILGTDNVIQAAKTIESMQRVVLLSTDKAVEPINFYGFTKGCAERLFVSSNWYRQIYNVVRYGNVMNSRGGVYNSFKALRKQKIRIFPITNLKMTRFVMSFEMAIKLVLEAMQSEPGTILVAKNKACTIQGLAKSVHSRCKYEIIGELNEEKLNEKLLNINEVDRCYEFDNYYKVVPAYKYSEEVIDLYKSKKVPLDFNYISSKASKLSPFKLKKFLEDDCKKFKE